MSFPQIETRPLVRAFVGAAIAATLVGVSPALAQAIEAETPMQEAPRPAGRFGGRLHIGAIGGAAAVEHVGGLAGGEIAVRISDRFELFGEGLWFADVATRRRVDLADTVRSFLQDSQGGPATSELLAPAAYGGGGIRVALLARPRYRLYGTATAGAAHVALQPTFTVRGADVTAVLEQYGVRLGSDLSGEVTRTAFGGGAGVRIPRGRWYLDVSLRLTSIQMRDQAANVIHANGVFGLVF